MNEFDFWMVSVKSSSKRSLKKALAELGSKNRDIETKVSEWVRYGSRQYPRYSYRAVVGFVEATHGAKARDSFIQTAEAKLKEADLGECVSVVCVYEARD